MDIDSAGLHLIEEFEGYSYHAYWDPYGRVWTVGYGETSGVGPGSTMTREQAEADLKGRVVREYEPAIKALGVPLNQNQFNALCSFVWNLGPGSMQWDIGQLLRRREYGAAANAMLEYCRAGGVVLQGLVNRRMAERRLFLTPAGPPPPPPDPYRVYPRGRIPGLGIDEHATVAMTHRLLKEPRRYRRLLKGLMYMRLRELRDRCFRLAKYLPPSYQQLSPHPAWTDGRHLGRRWHGLNGLMKEIEKIR
jgi:lysozyme